MTIIWTCENCGAKNRTEQNTMLKCPSCGRVYDVFKVYWESKFSISSPNKANAKYLR